MNRLITLASLFALIFVGYTTQPVNAQGGIYFPPGVGPRYAGAGPHFAHPMYSPRGYSDYPPAAYYPAPRPINRYGYNRYPTYQAPPTYYNQAPREFAAAPQHYQTPPVESRTDADTSQQAQTDIQEDEDQVGSGDYADYSIPSLADAFSSTRTTPPTDSNSVDPAMEKWIDVDLTNQRLTAYEGQTPVFEAIVSTGTAKYPTVVGTYDIYVKYDAARMRGGYGADAYDLPGVPYVMYFYQGYGLHGTYWHDNFGTPMSHGCVNLTIEDAEWVYNWASVGTKVVTRY